MGHRPPWIRSGRLSKARSDERIVERFTRLAWCDHARALALQIDHSRLGRLGLESKVMQPATAFLDEIHER